MPAQKLESFLSQFKLLSYKKRDIILRPDDIVLGIFCIKKGYVRVYSLSRDGEELTLIIFKPGDFFPLHWVLNNTPNIYTLEAMTSVEVWRVPKEQFVFFVKDHPDVLLELTRRILIRLGGLLDRMEHLVFGNAYEKVASILVILAQRFGKLEGNAIVIPILLTHKDIAALIGITRETVSTEIKKLENDGYIEYKGRFIVVKSPARLQKESAVDYFLQS